MEEKIGKIKYLALSFSACLILAVNFLYWRQPTLGVAFGLIYLIFCGFIGGSLFTLKKGWQIIFGLILIFASIAIFGALAIYFYRFTDYLFIFLLFLIPAGLFIPYGQTRPKEKFFLFRTLKDYLEKFSERQEPKANSLLVFIYLFFAAGGLIFLFEGQTAEAIQSPWQTVNRLFFLFYFLATATLLAYLFNSRRTKLPLLLLVSHAFLSSGAALIVYKIGFGFDPFIHQAAEKIINLAGTIAPKPLYYLGQYALAIFLSRLTVLDISLIDKILVPFLFALFLPTVAYYVFCHWLEKKYALILALAVLIIPYSGFIMTAPQNLANLFFIITILLSFLYFQDIVKAPVLYFLALAAIAIHPLAGIPLIIVVFLLNLFKVFYKSYRQYLSLYLFTSLIFIFVLPLVFLVNGSGLDLAPVLSRANWPRPVWVEKFDLPLDLAYLVYQNKIFIFGLIILAGLYYLAKHKLLKNNAAYLAAAFIVFANFLLTKYFVTFPGLNENDKSQFVNRLAILAFYVLIPYFLIGLYWLLKTWLEKSKSGARLNKLFLIFILAGGLTISLYFSYPRLNQYEPAKFFSLSESDIRAVNFIEQTAAPDHIVLANQMVGAAAIREFGFKKYYNNQFYYSMPMGFPRTLYDYYLEMVYGGAKRETMEKAMNEAGVAEAFFVINKYWDNSEKIAELAAQTADETYFNVDEGKIYIFRYVLGPNKK